VRLPPDTKSVSPAVLFRSLLPLLPVAALPFRFAGLPNVALRARAIHSRVANQVHDEAQCLPVDRRTDRVLAGYVAHSLIDSRGLAVFRTPLEVEDLPESEFQQLTSAVWAALCRMGPLILIASLDDWHRALCAGARDQSNSVAAYALGQAYDLGYSRVVDRPDRFWGVATGELLDGHWLVHRAARAVWEERQR
jgi:hypothetical protein